MTGKEKVVLFVCVENACRSLIAESYFQGMRREGWKAISAGTMPAKVASPRTSAMLKEVGLAVPDHPPQLLTEPIASSASLIVTMGCLDQRVCPAFLRYRVDEDWDLPDPASLDDDQFRALRDEIGKRVTELVRRLKT
jgi:protein-tyrosine-phosphatase